MKTNITLLTIGIWMATLLNDFGQSKLVRDPNFKPTIGEPGFVFHTILQPDGKIILAGRFSLINGTPRNEIARLHSDGSLDVGFKADLRRAFRTADSMEVLAVQRDGKLIIGGLNGSLFRLNSDGALDTEFNPGSGPDYAVKAVAVQSDGKIVIGGNFTIVNGTPRPKIARLAPNGRLETKFRPDVESVLWVEDLAVQKDGKKIVGGPSKSVNGRDGIVRLNSDGKVDKWFSPAPEAGKFLATQADGKILTGTWTGSVRLQSDGRLDTKFNTRLEFPPRMRSKAQGEMPEPPPPLALRVALQSDGKIIIGGNFISVNGTPRHGIARLNTNGSLDTRFVPPPDIQYLITIQPDGKILALVKVGTVRLQNVPDFPLQGIARLNPDGSLDKLIQVNLVFAGFVDALAVQSDDKIVVGGAFTTVNRVPRNGIARLNPDGSLDVSFDPGSGVDASIIALGLQHDGKIVISGNFRTVNGTPRPKIARLYPDGHLDTECNPGSGVGGIETAEGVASGYVTAVAVQSDGKIVIGGTFHTVNGIGRNGVARLNPDGSLDQGFDPGTGGHHVEQITVQNDGKIIIRGFFDTINNVPQRWVARLNPNGSLDSQFKPTFEPGNVFSVRALAVENDGRIIIGGIFTAVNGTPTQGLARLNGDGNLDISFNPDSKIIQSVSQISLGSRGDILIVGRFTVNGAVREGMAHINPEGRLESGFTALANDGASYTSAIQSDGSFLIGGHFTFLSDNLPLSLARFRIEK